MRMNPAARMAKLREKLATARLAACEIRQGMQGGFARTMQERHEMQKAENAYRAQAARLKKRIEAMKKKRKMFGGGGRKFKPSALALSRDVKRVMSMSEAVIQNREIIQKPYPSQAKGRHGWAFDLFVFKGKQAIQLVVKKYKLQNFPKGETQSSIAEKEFGVFQKLRKQGFHVPPTIRLIEIKGKKYVAITDLTRFGDVRTKVLEFAEKYAERSGFAKEAAEKVRQYVELETAEAKKSGLDINDAWEFVIDTKGKKITAFILDLGMNFEH